MEKRRDRKIRTTTNMQPSFVEVIIKEEPNENDENEALDFEGSTGGIENVNKHNTEQKSGIVIHHSRNRYTQVNPEEIDAWNIKKSYEGNVPGENKPIQLIDNEIILPQCRFCLRRVSFENLKIISNKHKAKALAAFQMRIFPRDVYPYACSNCLNLMDIFVDFKSSVKKVKRLLLTKRMHMESDGWDDVISIEAFKHCKAVVERHRMQIDTVYEECFNMNNEESVESTVESTQTVELDNSYNLQIEVQYNPKHQKSSEKMDDMVVIPAIEWDSGQDLCLNHNQFEQLTDCSSPNERIKNHKKMRNPPNTEEVVEVCLKDSEYIPPKLHSGNENNSSSKVNPDDDYLPGSSRKRSKKIRKAKSSTALNSKQSQEQHDDDNLPASPKKKSKRIRKAKPPTAFNSNQSQEQKPLGLRVLCDLCGESMWPESLESHKNRHLGIKPYTCPADSCSFTFYSRANMATHMRRMHDEKGVPSHKCDICGKSIRGKLGFLNAHKKRHTNEKNYVCQVCGKAFTMPKYLKQHSATHSGEFPHQCGFCGKKFNNKWSMKTHEKNIHEKNNHVPLSYDELMNVTIDSECTYDGK